MPLGENMRKLREEQKLTRQQLADKLYVSRQTVCRWENGSRCPDLITAKKLALELGVLLDDLVSDEDTKNTSANPFFWHTAEWKERELFKKYRQKLWKLIEIVSSVFLLINIVLVIQFKIRMPIWGTILAAVIIIMARVIIHLLNE